MRATGYLLLHKYTQYIIINQLVFEREISGGHTCQPWSFNNAVNTPEPGCNRPLKLPS